MSNIVVMPNSTDRQISELRDIITAEAREYVKTGGKMRAISLKTGVSQSAIRKIVYGDTRWPRLHTIVKLLDFFGYNVIAVRRNTRMSRER